MGKIGDLFVRLGLKSDDYKKGMNEAKKETESFGNKLGKMKAGALAVWAAIGTAITQFTKDVISSSNTMSDAWDRAMSRMKASYHNLIVGLKNANPSGKAAGSLKEAWSMVKGIFGNAKEAGDAAAEMTKAFDAEFELTHSIRLQRGAIQQELNELYTMMRDTTLKPGDRQAAAEKYKALLQPLADAEVAVYGNMVGKAIDAWKAGTGLNRSNEDIIDFFTNYGTNPQGMAAKYADITNVYENFKADKQNIVIFDVLAKYQEAANMMSNVDRELARTSNSIKATIQRDLEGIANAVKQYGQEDLKLDLEIDIDVDEEDMEYVDAMIQDFISKLQADQAKVKQLNDMITQSFVQSFSGAVQAITDAVVGIEGADFASVMAALLKPLANTAMQMGEMFMAEGLAIVAFEKSLKNPTALIAAGAALIAISAAVSSGLAKMTANPAGGASISHAGGTNMSAEIYEQDITVHVVGTISGNDIVLAGQKTLNKWSR